MSYFSYLAGPGRVSWYFGAIENMFTIFWTFKLVLFLFSWSHELCADILLQIYPCQNTRIELLILEDRVRSCDYDGWN